MERRKVELRKDGCIRIEVGVAPPRREGEMHFSHISQYSCIVQQPGIERKDGKGWHTAARVPIGLWQINPSSGQIIPLKPSRWGALISDDPSG